MSKSTTKKFLKFKFVHEETILEILNMLKELDSKNYKNSNIHEYEKKNKFYTITYVYDDKKIVIGCKFGDKDKNTCYDKSKGNYENETLGGDKIAIDEEFLIILYVNENTMYCSKNDTQNVVLEWLKDKFKQFNYLYVIFMADIEKFINSINSIKSIKIKATNDLWIKQYINPAWDEEHKEMPESTTTEMFFNRMLEEKYITGMYKKLCKQTFITEFEFCGESDDGFIKINKKALIDKKEFKIFIGKDNYYDIQKTFEYC